VPDGFLEVPGLVCLHRKRNVVHCRYDRHRCSNQHRE